MVFLVLHTVLYIYYYGTLLQTLTSINILLRSNLILVIIFVAAIRRRITIVATAIFLSNCSSNLESSISATWGLVFNASVLANSLASMPDG